jgi:hypothetical protein
VVNYLAESPAAGAIGGIESLGAEAGYGLAEGSGRGGQLVDEREPPSGVRRRPGFVWADGVS